jgi:hypothetical protein
LTNQSILKLHNPHPSGLLVANIGDCKMVRSVRCALTDAAQAGLSLDEGVFMNAINPLSADFPLDVELMMK